MKKSIAFCILFVFMFSSICKAELVTMPIMLRMCGNYMTYNYHSTTKMNIIDSEGNVVCNLLDAIRYLYPWHTGYATGFTGNYITIDTEETYYLEFDQGEYFIADVSNAGQPSVGFGVYFGDVSTMSFFDLATIRMDIYYNEQKLICYPLLPTQDFLEHHQLALYEGDYVLWSYTGFFCADSNYNGDLENLACYVDFGYGTYYYHNIFD